MVADLLRGFVREAWVTQLDWATLEKVNHSFISDDLREREDDVIWRVRWADEWIYKPNPFRDRQFLVPFT
jgi:hypothetical protein